MGLYCNGGVDEPVDIKAEQGEWIKFGPKRSIGFVSLSFQSNK